MDNEDIHAFLEVVLYRNISKAAAAMYISQSNLSARIARLEDRIGFQLFIRSRGRHNIELTPKGEIFLQYAEQIDYSLRQIRTIRNMEDRSFLSIGANNGIHQFTLNPFYQEFTVRHPEICLGLHTYHSSDIYTNVINNRFELGIVSNPKDIPGITTSPLFDEPLFVLARRDSPYYNGMTPEQLSGKDEIFIAYTESFHKWHDRYWPDNQYHIRLSDASDIISFMNDNKKWAFVSASSALRLLKENLFSIYRLLIDTPNFSFYLVEKNIKYQSQAAQIYKKELIEFLRNDINVIARI